MRRLSKRRAAEDRLYRKLRDDYLVNNPWCAVCGGLAVQVHHKAGRIGDRLTDVSMFLPVCHRCHREITERPQWAIRSGFSVSRVAS